MRPREAPGWHCRDPVRSQLLRELPFIEAEPRSLRPRRRRTSQLLRELPFIEAAVRFVWYESLMTASQLLRELPFIEAGGQAILSGNGRIRSQLLRELPFIEAPQAASPVAVW